MDRTLGYVRGGRNSSRAGSRLPGGAGKIVQNHFLSLRPDGLDPILTEYGRIHGSGAERYARKILPEWRGGNVRMSGTVTRRLFALLPPRMPPEDRYRLAEKVWRHFAPATYHEFTIGPEADVSAVTKLVSERLEREVTPFTIPESVRKEFDWLSADDVRLRERLLNHIRERRKRLALTEVRLRLQALRRHAAGREGMAIRAKSSFHIDGHTVTVWLDDESGANVSEGRPNPTGGVEAHPLKYVMVALGVVALLAIAL